MKKILKKKILFPYQKKAVNSLDSFFKDKKSGKGYLHIATGGGKTLVANYFLIQNLLSEGKTVLWLAWDWELLEQARGNLETEFFSENFNAVYISDSKSPQNKKIRESLIEFDEAIDQNVDFQIMYSTMQTFKNFSSLKDKKPDIIVIDEAHHGKNGVTEKEVFKYIEKHQIPVLGLSGTPKKRKDWDRIESCSFKFLVENGFLAKPILHSVRTDIKIDATKKNAKDAFNLIQQEVYDKLSKSKIRNQKIVDTYNTREHGKTIVFAIDIEHADKLAKLFFERDIRAYPIHSERGDASEAIEYFKKNKFDVAVAVNKLNQGIDIPDVQTLFITRPVTSDIMYSQMIGRGARICKDTGKESFLVVDFEDNFVDDELQRMIFEPKMEYFGSKEASKSIYSSAPKLRARRNKPETIFPYDLQIYNRGTWLNYHFLEGNDSFNLPLLSDQTFGIELEMTTLADADYIHNEKNWEKVAEQIFACMKDSLPAHLLGEISPHGDKYHKKDYTKFNLVYDGSCGWEIVSSVLSGTQGFELIHKFLASFSKLIEKVSPKIELNYNTGFHVHFGFTLDNLNLPRFLCNLYDIETHVACLLPPSRFNDFDGENYDSDFPNEYCVPLSIACEYDQLEKIKSFKKLKEILQDDEGEVDRYMSVNFKNLLDRDGIGTIEVRLHSGTLNAKKVLSWISLWMGVLDSARDMDFFDVIDNSDEINPTLKEFKNFKTNFQKILPRHLEMINNSLVPRSKEVRKLWEEHIF